MPSESPDTLTPAPPPARPLKHLPGKLGALSLPRQVLVLAFWPFLEEILNLMVGTVDLALAGYLHPQETAIAATDALSVAAFITWLMSVVYMAVGTGAGALISRAIGGRHRRLANAALGQAVVLAFTGGLLSGGIIFVLAGWVPHLTKLSGASAEYCTLYLRMLSSVAAAQSILWIANSSLRAAGDTRTPFLIMVVVNVVNAGATITFVHAPAPLGGHGVAGIAAGTVLAWLVGMMLSLLVLLRGWGGIRLMSHRLRPHWHTMKRVLRVAVPQMGETILGMWLATFLVLSMVGHLGIPGALGAHMIAIRVESFSFQPGFALGIAAATLCGQYLGLGDPQRARQAVKLAWMWALLLMTTAGLIFVLFPDPLIHVITDAPQLVEQARGPLRICGMVQAFFATSIVLAQALRGAGDTRASMLITYLSMFLIRVPAAYLLGYVLHGGLIGIWIGLCSDLAIRGVLFALRFWHGGWQRVKV